MNAYWIYAENKSNKYPEHTRYGGKWLLFVSAYNVNRIWMKIKKATEEGNLGGISKVATAKVNPEFPNSKVRIICVYTYDWRDENDVKRIREELRKISITRKISYKTDEDTNRGVYGATSNNKKISKYYE
ncbi:MAG: putative phosphothreonine lyase domain-containing protein [Candidatus Moraniibacteriota bacterium]